MQADKTILQMKYARIVKLFADHLHISYEDALDFFYNSDTYSLISEGIGDMHCLSDEYHDNYNHTLPNRLVPQ